MGISKQLAVPTSSLFEFLPYLKTRHPFPEAFGVHIYPAAEPPGLCAHDPLAALEQAGAIHAWPAWQGSPPKIRTLQSLAGI
jgi:hypothetical protein